MAGLVYEIVWTRLFTLHLGHTLAAVSTVLAAFLGGLGMGALTGGDAAARASRSRARRMFVGLELGVAVCALGVPAALGAMGSLFAAAYGDAGTAWFAGGRLIAGLVLVGVPAVLMGATFPFVVRLVEDGAPRQDRRVAALAACNTGGAALGAAAAGFFLIPGLGLQRTTLVACTVSAISATIAWRGLRRVSDPIDSRRTAHKGRHHGAKRSPEVATGVIASIVTVGVTGFMTTTSEVVWTRTLALIVGPTTYAFSAMLCVFIVGLALGSVIAARIVPHVRRPGLVLAIVLAIAGAMPSWSMTRVESSALTFGQTIATTVRFDTMVRLQVLTTAIVVLPVAVALGAAFTFALAFAAREQTGAVRRVGRLYAVNTAGAVAGSLCPGFVLVPAIGLQRTLVIASIVAIAGSAATLVASSLSRKERLAGLGACAAALVALWMTPSWDVELLSGGIYKYARYMGSASVPVAVHAGTLLYYGEGSAATVAVRHAAGVRSLSIDGKVDASTGGDMLTQKLLAHLPLLLHPAPRHVAIIGLGSGVTLGSALTHPIQRADVVEISPQVVAASHYFDAENRHALSDPRAQLLIGDGRSHFRFTRARYDVVISEPSNPWMAGMAGLFTREFFETVRSRLAPNGIFCQWAHTYDIRESDLRSIAATFVSVFPHVTVWLAGESDLLLIGSSGNLAPGLAGIGGAYDRPGVRDDLRDVAVANLDSLLETYAGGTEELRSFAAGATVQTDDRMALEFSAPRGLVERADAAKTALVQNMTGRLPPILGAARADRTAEDWVAVGLMFLRAEAYGPAYNAFASAIARRPADEAAIDGLLRAAAGAGRTNDAEAILLRALKTDAPDVPIRIALSRLAASKGDVDGAIAVVQPLMRDSPLDPRPYDQAAAVLADAGDLDRLREVAQYQQERWPRRAQTAYTTAVVAVFEGRLSDAYQTASSALIRFPTDPRLHNTAGAAAAGLRHTDDARRAFTAALVHDPRDPTAYINLGLLELETAKPDAAARRFAEALLLDPNSTAAREGLSRAESARRR